MKRGYYQNYKQYSYNARLNLDELEILGTNYP